MLNTAVAAVVWVSTILPVPNAIERVLELDELRTPVVKMYPAKSKVPADNVVVLVTPVVNAPASVVVPAGQLIVNAAIVLPLVVIVPVPTVVTVKPVNVPPVDNVMLLTNTGAVGKANAVVPKLRLLNQLLLVTVITAVPDPVSVKLGALVLEPLVLPNTTVRVIEASVVNPPVPVQVKPETDAIASTVVAAVV